MLKRIYRNRGLVYVTLGLWCVALVQFMMKEPVSAQETLAQLMQEEVLWQIEVSGWYPYQLEESAACELVEAIGEELGIREMPAPEVVHKENGFQCVSKSMGTYWESDLKYYHIQEVAQSYVTISLSMQAHLELADDYETRVREILERYEISGVPVVQFCGVFETLSAEEKEAWQADLLESLSAKVIFSESLDGYDLLYGYTEAWEETLTVSEEPMNFSVAIYDRETEGKTVVMVGFPYLPLN